MARGTRWITTTHTFTATAEVIRYLDADPVFVDVDAATLCIDVDAVARAITPRTKAIIPVHFAGRSADMTRLLALAKLHGLKVMEDAAHALPTTCDGRLIGTLESDVTVFSFYANKTITTGEGGMLVTCDLELASGRGRCVCTASTAMRLTVSSPKRRAGITRSWHRALSTT